MISEGLVDLQLMGMNYLSWECQMCQHGCFGMMVTASLFFFMDCPYNASSVCCASGLNHIGNA